METKSLVVFETDLLNTVYREFYDAEQLKEFIKNFNFTKLYTKNGKVIGINPSLNNCPPVFRLGTRFIFDVDGYNLKSEPLWGPRIWIGRSANMRSKQAQHSYYEIEVPFMRRNHYEKHSVVINNDEDLIVFKQNNLEQVYPSVNSGKSKLDEYLDFVLNRKFVIKER